jgi:hypothetical protein
MLNFLMYAPSGNMLRSLMLEALEVTEQSRAGSSESEEPIVLPRKTKETRKRRHVDEQTYPILFWSLPCHTAYGQAQRS